MSDTGSILTVVAASGADLELRRGRSSVTALHVHLALVDHQAVHRTAEPTRLTAASSAGRIHGIGFLPAVNGQASAEESPVREGPDACGSRCRALPFRSWGADRNTNNATA